MIAKGIKNATTGEVTQIEGAGYVYNEEKNSVAFGSGTIASGQDQFVFGRENYPDERYIIGPSPLLYVNIDGVKKQILYNKALFSKEEEALEYIHTNGISQITSINKPEGVTEIKGYVVWQAMIDGVRSKHIALFTSPIPQCEQGETVYTGIIGDSTITYSESATFDSCDRIEYIAPDTYVEIVGNGNDESKSNARTLDWEGNEELGGYLKTNRLVFKNVTVIGNSIEEREVTANEAFLTPFIKKVSSTRYTLKNYADDTDTIHWSFPISAAIEFAHTHVSQACILLAPANKSMGSVEWHPASGWSKFNKFTLWKSYEFQDDANDGYTRYMYEASIVCSATQGVITHLFLKREDYVTGTIKYYHYEPA